MELEVERLMAVVLADLIGLWEDFDALSDVEKAFYGLRMDPVSSSNLAMVGYDPRAYRLVIAFLDGSVYEYEGVPPEEYMGLMRADSHGEYFYDNIREVYSFERIS